MSTPTAPPEDAAAPSPPTHDQPAVATVAPPPVVHTQSELEPSALGHTVDLAEPRLYRLKKRILGPPINTDRLAHERLGKPTALAVFASDNLSSASYATEEILRVLIPAIGLLAFSLVVPITFAMLAVLGLLILSYRQTIKAYPEASGAYIVTRDNFGMTTAQVAGVCLLTDYVMTVAVSTAAGTAALASAFEVLTPYVLPISIFFTVLIAAGNLKGIKESGKAFAVPTYFFMVNMAILLGVGTYKMATGGLEAQSTTDLDGAIPFGSGTAGAAFMGAGLFVVLHAFASGGAAVTGVEAISDGVPAFKDPSWKNARTTLAVMGSLLAVMFLGLSLLASKVHAVPFLEGTPTVISQVGELVYGSGSFGTILFFSLQAGTTMILVLAANTGFADFPRLANFQAGDSFLPRQLTKRGHRLVFSNGIITLAVAAIVLLLITGAKVDKLIPMYAIGVFTSFTLSQSGMTKHHWKTRQPGWQRGMAINATGAVVSFIVLIVFAATKFADGAWLIIVIIPILTVPLFRLNKTYAIEERELKADARDATEARILDRHMVFVLIDQLDMAAVRALQYARTLMPDELVAVHFDLDPARTRMLTDSWAQLGINRLTLDVVDCPDRRIERGAAELVARELARGDTEITVLLPRREYTRFWHRLVHDRTADSLAKVLDDLPHCNVTIVPFHLGTRGEQPKLVDADRRSGAAALTETGKVAKRANKRARKAAAPAVDLADMDLPADRLAIADVTFRQRVRLAGKVYSMRVKPWSGVAALELTLLDDTGAITVVFFGRRELAGVSAGTRMVIEGMVGEHRGKMALLNPAYDIQLPAAPH